MSITAETRRESFNETKMHTATRQTAVWDALNRYGDKNADELAQIMHTEGLIPYPSRAFIAPRLTELKIANQVEVVGKSRSPISGKMTAVWRAVK